MATNSKYYDFPKIEQHWQEFWDENKTFCAEDNYDKEKYYVLDMFPYPSGEGLHIGHPEGYTATDIIGRYKKSKGFNVLHPMGWDAFGLPAEQHAIKTGTHPAKNTKKNIENFKRQLKMIGLGLDWDREINTTDPNYYKWTQWIFLNLFKKGLAYVDERPVWWCPKLATVLSNEEVINGKSEVGSHPVERRNLRQWVLRITAYADQLIKGLDELDWPDSTKKQQNVWIGRSEGTEVYFDVKDVEGAELATFTTRADTLLGVTFLVVAPEHPLLDKLVTNEHRDEIDAYLKEVSAKSDLMRTDLAKHKTGHFTGSYAINPINNEPIPIWVADYVLVGYGTGAVMGVPGYDVRDEEFAEKFGITIRPVYEEKSHTLVYFDEFDSLTKDEAIKKITQVLNERKKGKASVQYKLRDWLFSRQRYWGEPFPIVWVSAADYQKIAQNKSSAIQEFLPEHPVTFIKDGEELYAVPLPSRQLPLTLPEVESYLPSGHGESPLANVKEWVDIYINVQTGETCSSKAGQPSDGEWVQASRETNTMPQWAGSCWYYLRFLDHSNAEQFVGKSAENYWGTPDLYIGGAEHAVLHLLYARFWHQVLHELGLVSASEPFKKVVHQGLILGAPEHRAFINSTGELVSAEFVQEEKDKRTGEALTSKKIEDDKVFKQGEYFVMKDNPALRLDTRVLKMSKSRGNVISPDDIIKDYGADSLRLYEMFLGPLEANKPWSTKGIEGISRFLKRIWRELIDDEGNLNAKVKYQDEEDPETEKLLQETIKKVSEDIEALRMNTAISQLMILLNQLQKAEFFTKRTAKILVQLLAPFAPHLGEELWARLGGKSSLVNAPWPKYNESKIVQDTQILPVQINGKVRGELVVAKDISKEDVFAWAKSDERVKSFINRKAVVKEIYVPGRIVNFVVK